jgi:hypothetical protein
MVLTCRVCHRELKNPKSIRMGIGPVCLAKEKKEEMELKTTMVPPKFHGFILPADLERVNTKKVYTGIRGVSPVVTVTDGGLTRNLRHVSYHSPDGFEWGYEESGPADLARSILADFAGMKVADALYQQFKWAFIAKQPPEGFQISGEEILKWLEGRVWKF